MHPALLRSVAPHARTRLATALAALTATACSAGAPPTPATGADARAAQLTVEAPSGAAVYVDGVEVGRAPLSQPISLEPGRHSLALTATGHRPVEQQLRLEEGESHTASVDLEPTTQRTVSWVLLGTGAAALTTGIVFGVLSVVEQRRARDVQGRDEELDASQQQTYDDALSARDDYRVGSGLGAAAGFALFLVGGALFVLDDPAVPGAGGEQETGDGVAVGARLSVQPMVGPTVAGSSLTLRF